MRVTPQGGAPKKGGPRQVPRLPPLKHTTVCGQPEHFDNYFYKISSVHNY